MILCASKDKNDKNHFSWWRAEIIIDGTKDIVVMILQVIFIMGLQKSVRIIKLWNLVSWRFHLCKLRNINNIMSIAVAWRSGLAKMASYTAVLGECLSTLRTCCHWYWHGSVWLNVSHGRYFEGFSRIISTTYIVHTLISITVTAEILVMQRLPFTSTLSSELNQ